MSNKRPLQLPDHPSPAFSPPPTPASATYSPKTSAQLGTGRKRSKAPAKRRKSTIPKLRDGEGRSTGAPGLAEAGDEDDEAEAEEEEVHGDDDDYTIRKREDLANKDKLRCVQSCFPP